MHLLDVVLASSDDGYIALHNIMRYAHPALTDHELETSNTMPQIKNKYTFASYIRQVTEYFSRENVRGRQYSEQDKTRFSYENLPSKFQDEFAFKMEVELPPGNTLVPFKLQLPNISMTWTLWAEKLKLDPPNGFYKPFAMQLLMMLVLYMWTIPMKTTKFMQYQQWHARLVENLTRQKNSMFLSIKSLAINLSINILR